MHSHPNAHLTQKGRLRLVTQHLEHGRRLAVLAAENGYCFAEAFGYTLRCSYRWLARYRADGPTSLANRRRGRRSQRRTLDPQHLRHIARLLEAAFSSVAWDHRRLGLGRLRTLGPTAPVKRCAWERRGELIHIEVKSLARFRKVGHRITGDLQHGRSYGVGYDRVHVAVDDATRLAVASRGAPG
jgi:hypothetical protein